MKTKLYWYLIVVLTLSFAGFALVGAAEPLGPLPITLDPRIPEHQDVFVPMHEAEFGLRFSIDGALVYYMGTEVAAVPNDTYRNIKYAVLDGYPVDTFSFEFSSLSAPEGNQYKSRMVVYGWEDYQNYHYVYLASTNSTRVARVIDGKHETLHEFGKPTWSRDVDVYNHLRVSVDKDERGHYIEALVDGRSVLSYAFKADEVPPTGLVGIGSYNTEHLTFYRDVSLRCE